MLGALCEEHNVAGVAQPASVVLPSLSAVGEKVSLARNIRGDIHEPEMMTPAVRRGVRDSNQHSGTVWRDLRVSQCTHMAQIFVGRNPVACCAQLNASRADEKQHDHEVDMPPSRAISSSCIPVIR